MRIFAIAGMLCLLLTSCSTEGRRVECQLEDDGCFLLSNLDMKDDPVLLTGAEVSLDATLAEMPFTGTAGLLILKDAKGNEYRFRPRYSNMDWEAQLDGLQLGETYHFVLSGTGFGDISGMKIFNGKSLLYLGASYGITAADYSAFGLSGLEGFTAKQLHESRCGSMERRGSDGLIDLVTNLPVVFRYGDQNSTLYPTQEVMFTTTQGEFLVHLLQSRHVEPQNYANGGFFYSFYIKRI